ncbi:MAG: hypothetical protein ABSE47_08565 [Acidimicrobiales bacterium]|jgi:hypothetical protein
MSEPADDGGRAAPWRLWDHIGMISGVLLGLALFAFLVVLAVAGDPQAFGLVVVIVVGVALIYFGGRLHGLRGRS